MCLNYGAANWISNIFCRVQIYFPAAVNHFINRFVDKCWWSVLLSFYVPLLTRFYVFMVIHCCSNKNLYMTINVIDSFCSIIFWFHTIQTFIKGILWWYVKCTTKTRDLRSCSSESKNRTRIDSLLQERTPAPVVHFTYMLRARTCITKSLCFCSDSVLQQSVHDDKILAIHSAAPFFEFIQFKLSSLYIFYDFYFEIRKDKQQKKKNTHKIKPLTNIKYLVYISIIIMNDIQPSTEWFHLKL